MDYSLNKHVKQISFRRCVAFSEHGQLKCWQQHFQPAVAKSSISTIVHWFGAVLCRNWEHNPQSISCPPNLDTITVLFGDDPLLLCMRQVFHVAKLREQSLYCNKSWRPQLRDQTLCFSALDRSFFSRCKEGMGMTTPMQTWWSVLPLSGTCFSYGVEDWNSRKGMAGMDSLNKGVEQISVRQWVTFCEHRQLKGWQPHFQPVVAKSSISTVVHWFAAVT